LRSSPFPFVSVILPVRNEAVYISRSLGSVLAQDYPANQLEILIVDGMSDDSTRDVINHLAVSQDKFQVFIIDNPNLITPAALNCGFRSSKGEIIIRVDGHCEIATDYVRNCVSHLQKDDANAVGGSIETVGDNFMARAIAVGLSTAFGVGNSSFRTLRNKQMFTDTVPFPAYRRETMERLGEYDEEMLCNEDDEYNYRLLAAGGKILLANDIFSRYFSRGSLFLLWKQYYRYGLWKVRILQKYPRQMSIRQFVPPALVFALFFSLLFFLSTIIFSQFSNLRPLSSLVPLIYLSANLMASFWTAIKGYLYFFPLLPFIFVVLHFSYGVGFLVGLIKFSNYWGKKQPKITVITSKDA
jgi:succinoglycan biosynthesis protein ExoA